MSAALLLAACSDNWACEYEDEPIAPDDPGPHGFSANELLALVDRRAFDVDPDPEYADDAEPLYRHAPFTVWARRSTETSFVRTWVAGAWGPVLGPDMGIEARFIDEGLCSTSTYLAAGALVPL